MLLAPGSGLGSPVGSPAVRSLQRRLVGLGFSPGPVDGRYGPLTTGAVERLQDARGVAVDGIVGPQTRTVLGSGWLFPGAGVLLSGGSRQVRALQLRLSLAGVSPGPVDGRYGQLTTHAVERFQHAHHLAVDGIAGAHTQHALGITTPRLGTTIPQQQRHLAPSAGRPQLFHAPRAGGPQPLHHPAPATRKPHPNPARAIAHGGHSALPWVILALVVAALLLALIVIRGRGLRGRGPAPTARSQPKPPATDRRVRPREPEPASTTGARRAGPASNDLKPIPPVGLIADRGRRQDPRIPRERVRTLQRHLAWLGFEPGPVDGRYGPLTTGAVMRFQQAHDLPLDGQVGPLTVSAMRAERPTTAHVERIKALQTHLTWLGLDPGPIDGHYGPRTSNAVADFQRTHNLQPNGRVDPDTAHAIRTIILERPHGNPTHQHSEHGEP